MTSREHLQTQRVEWEYLGIELVHPECPLALDIDSAHDVLDASLEQGFIVQQVHAARSAVLQEKRIALGAVQARNGCARLLLSDQELSQDTKDSICRLPVGRVENFAFGTPDQMAATAHNPSTTNNERVVGFNNGR